MTATVSAHHRQCQPIRQFIGEIMTKRRPKGEGSVYRRNDGRVVGEYESQNTATAMKRPARKKLIAKTSA